MKTAAIAVLLAASWCQPKTSTPPDSGGPAEGDAPEHGSVELPPPGPVLDATIPLLGGGGRDLAELRERVVLLDVSSPDSKHWDARQARWRTLAEELGDGVAVVTVAVTGDAQAIRAQWDADPPPFVLGWDPQGALALRLGIGVPAIVVLDAQGRELMRIDGDDEAQLGRVENLVRAAVGASSSVHGGVTSHFAK